MNTRATLIRTFVILGIVSLVFLVGCGGKTSVNNDTPPAPTGVTVSPTIATVQTNGVQQFTATVSPSGANQAVTWSVSGTGCTGASCGTIDANGKYTAPATVPNPASVTVTARSVVDATNAGTTATVTIINVPSSSFSVNPASEAFGNQTVNTSSALRTVTLTNTGSAAEPVSVRMNGFNFADFAQTNDCPSVIAADASCTFSITFTPSATGDRIGVLVIDGSRDEEGIVNLTGTGIARTTGLPGTFTVVSSMSTARAGHTATLLPTGKVLIAGGSDGFRPLATAELYDPATGTFTPTGNMITARSGHTATLLANGKVLVASCANREFLVAGCGSAELYDPSSGVFTPTGNMTTARGRGPSTLLANGKVLFAGGDNAEIYDPAIGTFALTGAYADPIPVSWDTATLLLDGRVLLAGCAGAPQCRVGAAELFAPQSGAFSLTGPMQAWSDTVSAATLLMNGTVLLLQATFDIPPDGAEIYDPATGAFTYIGRTIGYHAFSAAVRLADGTVLITGGQLPGGNGSSATELYLPATRTFVSAGNMTTGRDFHSATLLPDGTVLIAGGLSIWGSPPQMTSTAEVYKPTRSGP